MVPKVSFFAIIDCMSRILDNEIMGDEEAVERTLRPQYLHEYIGQDKVKRPAKKSLLRQPSFGMRRWIMSFFLALQGLGKPPWLLSLPMNWVSISSRLPVLSLKRLVIGSYPQWSRAWRCPLYRWDPPSAYVSRRSALQRHGRFLHRYHDWRWWEQPECPSGPSSFHFDWGNDSSWYAVQSLACSLWDYGAHGILWARWFDRDCRADRRDLWDGDHPRSRWRAFSS